MLAFTAGAAAANADPTFAISGTISDASGVGVGDLDLVLDDSTGGTTPGVSNPNGTYSFAGLAPDTYTLMTPSGGGYLAISSSIAVSTADVEFDLTDPRFSNVSGVATAGGVPLVGLSVIATVAGHTASDTTNGSGAFSFTLPAINGSYVFTFTDGTGVKLATSNYSLAGGPVTPGSPCVLVPDAAGQAELLAGGSVALSVALDPDPAACSPASATPASPTTTAKAAKPRHASLAITGGAITTASPSPTSSTAPAAAPTTTTAGTSEPRPALTESTTPAPMPVWGWVLVGLAFLLMSGGVGFTVARHR